MITIAIPTYNRLDLLKIMAESLYNSELSVPYNIRIYDDCSNEYGVTELQQLFPNAASIRRNVKNIRADANMYMFYKDFLFSEDDFLFNADSDIIFNRKWLNRSLELIKNTDGVLSIFNATSHPVKEIISDDLCIKEAVGAAGTLFTRERVKEIINHFSTIDTSNITSFDWEWSYYLNERKIRIFCTNASMVQHIGYRGQNMVIPYKGYKQIKIHKPYFDYGKNFTIDTIQTGQIINNIFEQFIEQNRTEDERVVHLFEEKKISKIKKIIKKLIHYKK